MVGGGAGDQMISGNRGGCQYTLKADMYYEAKFVVTGTTRGPFTNMDK